MKVVQYKVVKELGAMKVKFWLVDNPKMFAEEIFVILNDERLKFRIKMRFNLIEPFEIVEFERN